MISDMGITNSNNRYIAQNPDHLNRQLGLIIPVKLLLSIFYCIITLIIAFLLEYSNRQFSILILLIINQMLVSFLLYFRSNISALQFFNTDSIISIIDKMLMVIVCGILLWGNPVHVFRIEWLVYAQTFSYSATFIIAFFLVIKKSSKPIFNINYNSIIHTLKTSSPFALLAILMILYTRIDAVMLERILPEGKVEVGIYAQAFRISDALSMFAFLFASILLPLFAKMLKDKEPIGTMLGHSFAMLMIPATALIIILHFYSRQFMDLLYHQHSEQSAKILVYLLIGFGGICLSYLFGTLLTSAGKLKILNQIAFAGLAFNVVLNLVLIPSFGIVGAAITSMITQLIMGIVQAFVSFKILKIKVRLITPFKYSLHIMVTILITFVCYQINLVWYISIIAILFFSIALGLFLRLIKFENLRQVFK
jgi:O-antigen/teichoic acid export membrane protein